MILGKNRLWLPLTYLMALALMLSMSPALLMAQDTVVTSDAEISEDDEDEDDDWGDEEGDDDWGEGDGGFAEIDIQIDSKPINQDFDYGGWIRQDLAYNFQETDDTFAFSRKDAAMTKVRSTLFLFSEWKLPHQWKLKLSGQAFYDDAFRQQGRDLFHNETLRAYESEVELRDTFIEGPLIPDLWLKLGKQVIAWGESEGSQVVDLANPRDLRELGQVNVEDARLPVTATKLTWIQGEWEINGVAIHEVRPNKDGTQGSDYDPYIFLRDNPIIEIESAKTPENSIENTEWLLRVFRSFNGGDISFIYADVFEDSAFLEAEFLSIGVLELTPRYQRIQALGVAGNRVWNSFLFRLELAQKQGQAFNHEAEEVVFDEKNWSEKNTLNGVIGFDYTGVQDLTVTLETSAVHIQDYEDKLQNEETTSTSTFLMSYDTWNQTLSTQVFWVNLSNQNGDIFRVNLEYDVIDALQVSGGVVFYEASNNDDFVYPYRANDRLLAGLKYSF